MAFTNGKEQAAYLLFLQMLWKNTIDVHDVEKEKLRLKLNHSKNRLHIFKILNSNIYTKVYIPITYYNFSDHMKQDFLNTSYLHLLQLLVAGFRAAH